MMRVTTNGGNAHETRYLVEGRIDGQSWGALGALLDDDGDGRTRILDLSGVSYVDAEGLRRLRAMEGAGVILAGGSPFVNELLRPVVDESTEPAREPSSDDDALVARLRRGEDAAYEDLVRRNAPRMLATARRLLRREEDAEDAVQEAFLSAFRGLDSFQGGARLSTWLHRIVVNAALMKLRRRRRKPEEPIGGLLPRFDEEGEWIADESLWAAPSDELLARRESLESCRRCIDRLPERYRTVLMLRDIEELPTDEVAALLDLTPNAVKVRLHRARQALRTSLSTELGTKCAKRA